ncbi:MAG: DNA gyrase inhibitor YacG [Planctomycetota bacterium]
MKTKCPTCRSPSARVERGAKYFPFCSERCRDQDLVAWLDEKFVIPTEEPSRAADFEVDSRTGESEESR